MPAEIHCPNCQSENVIFSKKRGVHVCEDCGHVLPEKPVEPMRIFLSYGHDDNEPLVRRIKADLETRGHDVWFDKNEIRPGDSWRRSITDGILECDRFLSFLSKHSTRDPGVCRDEIAISIGHKDGNIQTILVESESEVQPPVSISHVQWLDMHDWKDGHGSVEVKPNQPALGDPSWESWYDGNWKEIQRIIESEQSRQFAGEMNKLSSFLKPIKSHTRIKQLLEKGFIGRKWLFDAVEAWRNPGNAGLQTGPSPSRLFWITGDPGVGKSAFAAQLTHTHPAFVIAAQFVEWDKPDHRDARRVVRSLAFQLATRLPDYRKLLLTLPEIAELDRKDAAELFDYLLANPLKTVIGGGRERLLIVIDALDEAGEAGRNPLVEMLARHASRLPDWLGLVVTSRSESHVTLPFQCEKPVVLDKASDENIADLRNYLHHHLAPQLKDRSEDERLVEQILGRSEGVMLYVELFCDGVQHNHLSLDRPEQFPQGLGGIFCQYFQRQYPDDDKYEKIIQPALGAILGAREPLPVDIFQKLFEWRETELRKWLRILGSLFPVMIEAGNEIIKPYHKSLADWLSEPGKAGKYFVSMKEGQQLLSESGWKDYQTGPEQMSTYFLKHLPAHLVMVGDKSRSRLVRQDKHFIHAREIRIYGERRAMHVYICSTFRDMGAERDYLIRRTFPELNRLLDPHRIDATAVDLRWGLPEEVFNEGGSDAVMNYVHGEMSKCRPFFVGLIGDRYGWIPQNRERSVTEDELDYFTKNPPEGKVGKFVYVRRRLSPSELPANVAAEYFTPHSAFDHKMAVLRARLSQLALTQRDYDCYWDDQRKQLWGLQNFGSQVLRDLYRSAIEVFGSGPQYASKIEQRLQRDYEYRLLKTFIGRNDLIDQCYSHLRSTMCLRMCLVGAQGVGKSALLSVLADKLRSSADCTVALHHGGVSARSITVRGVLEGWCGQLEDWLAKPITESQSVDDLRSELSACAKLACAEGTTVFMLDNADWVESASGVGSVGLLLQSLPKEAVVLMSSRDVLVGDPFCSLVVMPMAEAEIRLAIKTFLSSYSKQLSTEQIDIVLSKPGVRHPGILVLMLRNLLASVRHNEELAEHLRNMPDTFVGQCGVFFDSLEYDYGKASVNAAMSTLIRDQEQEVSTSGQGTPDEAEILRQVYSVFPEHCTPPEEGIRIRSGTLLEAIRARYVR